MKSQLIRLERLPEGSPKATDFALINEETTILDSGMLLLKTRFISVDPYLRAKMSGGHTPPLHSGDNMYSRAIAEVVESRHPGFKTGDHIAGFLEWRDYLVHNGEGLTKVTPGDLPLSAHLSILGSTGLSAYFALTAIGKPKSGETLVVSGAAGAVGSIAGQIGKLMGCKVIGIAGSDEKLYFLKDLGFDEAFNYQKTNLSAVIGNADIYFDNVGGEISDAVISNMNDYGRVVICGSIASYNDQQISLGPRLLPLVVYKKLLIQGFLITDFKNSYQEGISQLSEWIKTGRLKYAETVMDGFEKLPEAFIGLFEGKNLGKMIVQIT